MGQSGSGEAGDCWRCFSWHRQAGPEGRRRVLPKCSSTTACSSYTGRDPLHFWPGRCWQRNTWSCSSCLTSDGRDGTYGAGWQEEGLRLGQGSSSRDGRARRLRRVQGYSVGRSSARAIEWAGHGSQPWLESDPIWIRVQSLRSAGCRADELRWLTSVARSSTSQPHEGNLVH